MEMKKLKCIIFLPLVFFAACLFVSCSGLYDDIKKYEGVIIYPGRFDTLIVKYGLERVEFELMKAGRLPSSEMKLSKAVKTVVEYDDKRLVWDEVRSWVPVEDLNEKRLYRFSIYTLDDKGNKSVPWETQLVPYTVMDRDLLDVVAPRQSLLSSSALIEWPNGLNSALSKFVGLCYSFTDNDGISHTDSLSYENADFRISFENLVPYSNNIVNFRYWLIPILSDGETAMIDTVLFEKPLNVLLDPNLPFSPAERDMLIANGITNFTLGGIENVTSLSYAPHATDFSDLYFFERLKTLDLTAGVASGNPIPLPTLSWPPQGTSRWPLQINNGGFWKPYLKVIEPVTTRGKQTLIERLESGTIEKVYYMPGSMDLDATLAPYVTEGLVELVTAANYPEMFPATVQLDGASLLRMPGVGTNNFAAQIWYPYPKGSVDYPSELGLLYFEYPDVLKFKAGQDIDCPLTSDPTFGASQNRPSLIFNVPAQYQIDTQTYPYFTFRVLIPSGQTCLLTYPAFRSLQFWVANYMDNYSIHNTGGYPQNKWQPSGSNTNIHMTVSAPDGYDQWHRVTVNFNAWGTPVADRKVRTILIRPGAEQPLTPVWNFNTTPYWDLYGDFICFFTDIFWSKTEPAE